MIFLQTEPIYVVSLKEVLWGGALIALTMGIHGFGMVAVRRFNHIIKDRLGTKLGIMSGIIPIILASCLIFLVHLSEVVIWATFLSGRAALRIRVCHSIFPERIYHGGQKFDLPREWRLPKA
jgi:hypothetical protein